MKPCEFPIKTQIGCWNSENELCDWFDNWEPESTQIAYFDFCLIGHWPLIFAPCINDLLERHFYLKNYQIYSFSQNFDALPAVYIDGLNIIEKTISDITKWQQKTLT